METCIGVVYWSYVLTRELAHLAGRAIHKQASKTYWKTYDRVSESKRDRRLRKGTQYLDPTTLVVLPQPKSDFLGRLPLELRQMIYDYYFESAKLLVVPVKRRLRKRVVAFPVHARTKNIKPGALPLTCKQIYLECIETLYSTITFCFMDSLHLPNLQKSISPKNWNTITAIELNASLSWLVRGENLVEGTRPLGNRQSTRPEFWESIESLGGLQRFRLWADYTDCIGQSFRHGCDDNGRVEVKVTPKNAVILKLPSGKVFISGLKGQEGRYGFQRVTYGEEFDMVFPSKPPA